MFTQQRTGKGYSRQQSDAGDEPVYSQGIGSTFINSSKIDGIKFFAVRNGIDEVRG